MDRARDDRRAGRKTSLRGAAVRAARYLPDRFTLALAGLAAVSGASILPRQAEFGPGIDRDSAAYVCIARSLLAGEGYAGCGGTGAMEYWPPLYPALLAAASLPGFDPREAAGPLNAVILGALVFAAGQWLRRNIASRPLAAAGCLAAASSVPLAWISSWALPDPAFILFSALALIWADRRLEDGRRASLAWAAAFSALAWATRCLGGAVVVAVALALLLERRSTPSRKARDVWLYAAISAAPVCAWIARYPIGTGWFFAPSEAASYTLGGILAGVAETAGGWLAHEPAREADGALGPHGVLGAAVLLFAAAAAGCRGARALPRTARPRERSFLLFGGFAFAYIALLAHATPTGLTLHGLQPRRLLPVYLPFLFMAFLAADRLAGAWTDRRAEAQPAGRASALVMAMGLVLWLSWGGHARLTLVREDLEAPFGGLRWGDSGVVRYVRDNPGGVVWTNADRALRLAVGEEAEIRQLPPDLAEWRKWMVRQGDRIVWLHDPLQERPPYDASDIYAPGTARLLAAAGDGLVFGIGGSSASGRESRLAEAVLKGAPPAAESVFDVHIGNDGGLLIYVKRECGAADSEARFFLRVSPLHAADLPGDAPKRGIEIRDFDFERNGMRDGNACLAFAALPQYGIARVSTGQFDDDGELWRTEFAPPRPGRGASPARRRGGPA